MSKQAQIIDQALRSDAFAHVWLCHNGDHRECLDGCDAAADREKVALLTAEHERRLRLLDLDHWNP